MKKIQFKKDYEDDARWTEILSDFLEYLSKKYGYTIDEYSLYSIIWSIRINKLSPLLKDDSGPVHNYFNHCVNMSVKCHKIGDKLREDYRNMLQILMPVDKDEEFKDED